GPRGRPRCRSTRARCLTGRREVDESRKLLSPPEDPRRCPEDARLVRGLDRRPQPARSARPLHVRLTASRIRNDRWRAGRVLAFAPYIVFVVPGNLIRQAKRLIAPTVG